MNELPAALKARVPTLTEVLEAPEMPDLGDEPLWPSQADTAPRAEPPPFLRAPVASVAGAHADARASGGQEKHVLAESVIASLAPQVEALVSSRLRDVLAPTIQEAVEEAIEQLRQPLIDALQVQLREQLELALANLAPQDAAAARGQVVTAGTQPATSADTPPNSAGLRFS